MDQTAELLKTITEADGVPGYESDIRAIMREYLEDVAVIQQDAIRGQLYQCRYNRASLQDAIHRRPTSATQCRRSASSQAQHDAQDWQQRRRQEQQHFQEYLSSLHV